MIRTFMSSTLSLIGKNISHYRILDHLGGGGMARDRGPSWSPDGKRVVFYSTRSDRYEFWSVNADGSGLQQLTKQAGRSLRFPRYSPDSLHLMGYNGDGTGILDLTLPFPIERRTELPAPAEKLAFQASSWSPDGKKLAGLAALQSDNSTIPGLLIYSLDSGKYSVIKDVIPGLRQNPIQDVTLWMNDGRRLLVIYDGSIYVVDSLTGKARLIFTAPGIAWLSIPQDNRWIYLSQQADEADVWLAKLH
jgi:Tol biopolymer transport system component